MKSLNILLFLMLCFFAQAQSIEREVISSAGAVQTISGSAIVSWSVGEPVIGNYLSTNDITQGFQQGEKSVILPVKLLDFNAVRTNPLLVDLEWEAAWSGGFKGFWLERRLEHETDFTPLIFIERKEQTGTVLYNYQDENPHFDNSYYRLKMIENDERFIYSGLKVVKGTDLQHDINIFPNPFDQVFSINILPDARQFPQQVIIRLFDVEGSLVYFKQQPFQHHLTISDIKQLISGWYFLKIELDDEKEMVWKIFKK